MDPNVIVDTAVVPGVIFTERTISLCDHFRVDFLVALAHCLVFVQIIQPDHRRRIPMIIITLLDYQPGMGHQKRLYDVFGVNAAASHCLAACLLQWLEQPACLLGMTSVFGYLLDVRVELGDVQPQLPLVQQLS